MSTTTVVSIIIGVAVIVAVVIGALGIKENEPCIWILAGLVIILAAMTGYAVAHRGEVNAMLNDVFEVACIEDTLT